MSLLVPNFKRALDELRLTRKPRYDGGLRADGCQVIVMNDEFLFF